MLSHSVSPSRNGFAYGGVGRAGGGGPAAACRSERFVVPRVRASNHNITLHRLKHDQPLLKRRPTI